MLLMIRVAMIVNDLITVGARPLTLMAYWAAGSSKWFEDEGGLMIWLPGGLKPVMIQASSGAVKHRFYLK
jgi:hypothetical protein